MADAQGLSFYSDAAIGRRLTMDQVSLSAARQQLIQADLIAYRKPLYQVLSLPPACGGAAAEGNRGTNQERGCRPPEPTLE